MWHNRDFFFSNPRSWKPKPTTYTTVPHLVDSTASYVFDLHIYSDKPNSKSKITISSQCLVLITIISA